MNHEHHNNGQNSLKLFESCHSGWELFGGVIDTPTIFGKICLGLGGQGWWSHASLHAGVLPHFRHLSSNALQ